MIRFSAFLVAVAVGLLIAGVVTSKLVLVYIAIGVSGLALLALGVGTVINRRELFGGPKTAEPDLSRAEPAGVRARPAYSEPQLSPQSAAVPAGSSWPTVAQAGPSVAGYLPADAMAAGGAAAAWESGVPAAGLPGARPGTPVAGNVAGKAAVEQPPAGSSPAQPADFQRPPAAATPRTAKPPRDMPGPAAGPAEALTAAAAATAPAAPASAAPADASPPAGAEDQDQVASPAPGEAADHQRAVEAQPPARDPRPAKTQQTAGDQLLTQREPPARDQQAAQSLQVKKQAAGSLQAKKHERRADQHEQGKVPVNPAGDETGSAKSGGSPAIPQAAVPPAAEAGLQREVTVVPGVPRYHNARCILIRFMGAKDLDTMTLAAARKAGCTPCRACLPDQPEKDPELPSTLDGRMRPMCALCPMFVEDPGFAETSVSYSTPNPPWNPNPPRKAGAGRSSTAKPSGAAPPARAERHRRAERSGTAKPSGTAPPRRAARGGAAPPSRAERHRQGRNHTRLIQNIRPRSPSTCSEAARAAGSPAAASWSAAPGP